MANVFIEPSPGGDYQIEFADKTPTKAGFQTQAAAISEAKRLGHKPLVARVRHMNDKNKPDHWREA